MKNFEEAYSELNNAQRQAVDAIDGPVMIVAGPGTGKTQLLSMRVANILHRTDVLANNILCLTFTESGAMAMRERLVELMGQEAYKVAIHTFHSFGTEIINRYPEYFYKGAPFRPADELSSYEVLESILQKLPYDNPLASTMNGQFTAIRDIQSAIGDLKKSGLTPDELLKILDHNDEFIALAEPILAEVCDVARLSKKDLPRFENTLTELKKIDHKPSEITQFKPLSTLCVHQLETALNQANEQSSTKPITAWRNAWLERNDDKKFVFRDRRLSTKLRALADVYYQYLVAMNERELFDFDDMILRVVHGLEVFNELRFNLQEQYQYILVDEFQDTNGAQMRVLQNLTNNPVMNQRPNIMVVGDDDQAIYSFQGAEIGNILTFRELYSEPVVITLTENYRSVSSVLQIARELIIQGENRLENKLEHIDKTLIPHKTGKGGIEFAQFAAPTDEYSWVVQEVKKLITSGQSPNEIAILGRNHRQLLQILPYLNHANISVVYERRENVLDTAHIQALILMANTVVALGNQRFDIVDELLPRLLSYPFWGVSAGDIWQLSLQAYKQRRLWLELMLERDGKLRDIAEFLIFTSHAAHHEPLEIVMDFLIGSNESQAPQDDHDEPDLFQPPTFEGYVSPFRAYYFSSHKLDTEPAEYLTLLSNLTTIRQRLREYRPDEQLSLRDFVEFVDLHKKTGLHIVDTAEHREQKHAIRLMTAHKSKGLEFDTVFVIGCTDNIWGASARAYRSSLSLPHNLPIQPAGETDDDRLRLFYVAATRARYQLYLTYAETDIVGREVLPAKFMQIDSLKARSYGHDESFTREVTAIETTWRDQHISLAHAEKMALLAPALENYKLSTTHLNNFIDVTQGGPQAFLLQNLLRFPQAMTSHAIFGASIHTALQRAHGHLAATGKRRPIEDILNDFENILHDARLSHRDFDHLLQKGSDVLSSFFDQRYDSFTPEQIAERNFANQGVFVGKARLSGAIDLMEIDKDTKTIIVTDYKTGKAPTTWLGRTDYDKIKLHKYRQQLMMYKLLVENSRDWQGYKVKRGILEFVQLNSRGQTTRLELEYDHEELQQFIQLIQVVWQKIVSLDLPDTSDYDQNHKGVLKFEADLLQQKP